MIKVLLGLIMTVLINAPVSALPMGEHVTVEATKYTIEAPVDVFEALVAEGSDLLVPDQEIEICVDEMCETFFYDGMFIRKGGKKKAGTSPGQLAKDIIGGISKGMSMGGTVKISKIKIKNTDGSSFEMEGLEITAGTGISAPTPGFEGGKQKHKF